MKRIARPFILLAGLIGVFGCGNVESMDLAPRSVFEGDDKPAIAPDFGSGTRVALLNGMDRLYVGVSPSEAIDFYGRPKRSYEFRDLPTRFKPPFKAVGWETTTESFGIISYDNRTAAAIREFVKVDDDRVKEEVDRYSRRFDPREPLIVEGKSATYWIWEIERHRMVICSTPAGGKSRNLTLAIGELNTMDALRFSQMKALDDIRRADRALEREPQ